MFRSFGSAHCRLCSISGKSTVSAGPSRNAATAAAVQTSRFPRRASFGEDSDVKQIRRARHKDDRRLSKPLEDLGSVPKTRFSSKAQTQIDRSTDGSTNTKHLLYPHVLSARIKKWCVEGELDIAVLQLKNAPMDAQNTPVWNTLIWETMKAKRFKLAYELYIDMKRRGLKPTTRTFQTMFTGLSKIERWETHPRQLENAYSLYQHFLLHINAVKAHDPTDPELTVQPLAQYITLLGEAQDYQRMFDVFYAMDSDGPMAPDQFIFTAMFQALSQRKHLTAQSASSSSVAVQNASDVKLLWRQMVKASEKSPGFPIDSHAITSAIRVLSRSKPTDQSLALDIVCQHFGLSRPGESSPPATVPLTPQSLDAVLELCNNAGKYRLCVHFAQQIIDNGSAAGVLDRRHMEHVLAAQSSLAQPGQALETLEWMLRQEAIGAATAGRLRPVESTYTLLLTACWRAADWDTAIRAFELMSGYKAWDFADPDLGSRAERGTRTPQMDKRSAGRNIVPGAEAASCMIKTALATRDRAHIRQCLRIMEHIGPDHLFALPSSDPAKATSRKEEKSAEFYQSKLASGLVQLIDVIHPRSKQAEGRSEGSARWLKLRQLAEEVMGRREKAKQVAAAEGQVERSKGVLDRWGSNYFSLGRGTLESKT